MLFKKYQTEIRNLLRTGYRQKTGKHKGKEATYWSGIYIFSRLQSDDYFKVGMSTTLYNRLLNQYKVCYSFDDEFHLKYILLTASANDTKKLEKLILNSGLKKAETNYSEEWKVTSTENVLKDKIKKVLSDHRDLWVYVLVFSDDSWKIVGNIPNTPINLEKPTSRAGRNMIN